MYWPHTAIQTSSGATNPSRTQASMVSDRTSEETRSYGYWAYNNSTSDEPLRRVNSMATDSALDGDGSPVETKTTNDHAGALCAAPLMLSTFANCAWRVGCLDAGTPAG